MIVRQSHRSQGRRQSGRELETLQQDRLQKYTLLIINELAIDQFSLLRVNTITDSQVQGDRNSDEGTHNSCKRTLISRLCSVLRSHPKMGQLPSDARQGPSPTSLWGRSGPRHPNQQWGGMVLSVAASGVWRPASCLGLGTCVPSMVLPSTAPGKDQAVTVHRVPVHEAPACRTFPSWLQILLTSTSNNAAT